MRQAFNRYIAARRNRHTECSAVGVDDRTGQYVIDAIAMGLPFGDPYRYASEYYSAAALERSDVPRASTTTREDGSPR